jgi:hypothetical protein
MQQRPAAVSDRAIARLRDCVIARLRDCAVARHMPFAALIGEDLSISRP